MSRRRLRPPAAPVAGLLAAAALLCAAVVGAPARAQADPPAAVASASASSAPSEAEQLLFMHPHLAATHGPRKLAYAYVAEAASAPRAEDRAAIELRPRADATCCTVHVDYLSGPMAVNLPDLDDAAANPILLYFLESEVRLMQRTTKGQSSHFRRQMRQSLVDSATVADTQVRWGGKDVAARVVRVSPFLDDPFRMRFEQQAATRYEFVLSDAVPGGIYRLSATLPGDKAGGKPLAERSLTLVDPQPAATATR